MNTNKQDRLVAAFSASMWVANFGECSWKVTYPNGEVYTSKGWKEPTAKKEFEAKPYVMVGGKK